MPQLQYLDMPTWGQALGNFGSSFLGEVTNKYKQNRENEALNTMLDNLSPDMQEEDLLKEILKEKGVAPERKQSVANLFSQARNRQEQNAIRNAAQKRADKQFELAQNKYNLDVKKLDQKESENYHKIVDPYKDMIYTLDRMAEIRKRGRLGWGSEVMAMGRGETSKDVEAYKLLGKSLISKVSGVPIRNRLEFETLSNEIMDPTLSDKGFEGIYENFKGRAMNGIDVANERYSGLQGKNTYEAAPEEIQKKLSSWDKNRTVRGKDGTEYQWIKGQWRIIS